MFLAELSLGALKRARKTGPQLNSSVDSIFVCTPETAANVLARFPAILCWRSLSCTYALSYFRSSDCAFLDSCRFSVVKAAGCDYFLHYQFLLFQAEPYRAKVTRISGGRKDCLFS